MGRHKAVDLPGPLMVVCPIGGCGHATLDLDVRWLAVEEMGRHVQTQHPEQYGLRWKGRPMGRASVKVEAA